MTGKVLYGADIAWHLKISDMEEMRKFRSTADDL